MVSSARSRDSFSNHPSCCTGTPARLKVTQLSTDCLPLLSPPPLITTHCTRPRHSGNQISNRLLSAFINICLSSEQNDTFSRAINSLGSSLGFRAHQLPRLLYLLRGQWLLQEHGKQQQLKDCADDANTITRYTEGEDPFNTGSLKAACKCA